MKMARIMVVEDEGIVARDIQNRLKGLGYAVPAIASSGLEAIEKAAETQPDLVLMDIRLRGDMDGVKAAEQIGARFSIPIIYLTAYADEETLERAKLTEPFGYILKPFEDRELHTAIQMGLYKHDMEKKLRESEQWLATTLSSIGDGVITSDSKGHITFLNPMAEAITGWKREEALDKELTEVFNIVNLETRAPAENPVMKVLREGTIVNLADHTLITHGETEKAIGDSGAPIRDEKGNITGAVLVFRDITQRRQAEQERTHLLADTQRHLKRITALREITLAMTSTLELRAVLEVLLEKIDLLLPYPIATIRLLNRETGQLEPVACRNLNEEGWKIHIEKNQGGLSRAVFEDGTPKVITNLQADPRVRDREFLDREGVVSYLGVPMVAKGEILGVLAFSTREEHSFSDEEVEFLTTLAGQAAIAVHNSSLYEQVQRRTHELAALYDITTTVNQSLEMEPVLQEVIKKITEIFHFDATRIYLFNTQMDELHLRASFETLPDCFAQVRTFRRGQGNVGRVAETGEPLIFEDIHESHQYQKLSHTKNAQKAGFRFFAVFPVKVKEKSVGTMVCIGRMPRSLTTDEVQLITSMAEEIGVSVENARLFEETASRAKQLSALHAVAASISESLDLETVLREVIQKVLGITRFEAARIYLLDPAGKELRLSAHHGLSTELASQMATGAVGMGISGNVAVTGEPAIFEDIQTDPEYARLAARKLVQKGGFRSYMSFPLKTKTKTLGVMNIVTHARHHFTHEELQLIGSMANQIGVAVENANLFEEVKRKSFEQGALREFLSNLLLLDLDSLLERLTQQAVSLFKAEIAWVRLFDKQGKLWSRAIAGDEAAISLMPVRAVGELVGRGKWMLDNRKPLAIMDMAKDPGRPYPERFKAAQLHGFLGAPLFSRDGKPLGVIFVITRAPREFSQREIELIEQFANGAAISIQNARLFEEVHRKSRELEALVKVNRDVAALLDRETLLPRITEEARSILKVDVASFRLIEGKTMVRAGYAGKVDLMGLRPRLHLGESITGKIIRGARPVAIQRLQEEPAIIKEHRKLLRKSGYHSFLGVPLLVGGQIIGTINFYSKEEREFQPEEISLISGFADQAAIAVENARLYAQTKEQATQLEKDIIEQKQAEEELKRSREQLRHLARHLQSVRETERSSIAREIHDELGQSLTGLKMDLSWLHRKLSKNQHSLLVKTKSMLDLIDQTIQTVRKIAAELRPGALDELGLAAAIEWQFQEFQNRTGIKGAIRSHLEEIHSDQARSTAVFRIFQEALTNIARHAKATRVNISLQEEGGSMILHVTDNGRGIKESKIFDGKSLGLLGMRERALPLGGEVAISGRRGEGTTVTVRIPLN